MSAKRFSLATALLLVAVLFSQTAIILAPLPLTLLRRSFGRVGLLTGMLVGSGALAYLSAPLEFCLFVGSGLLSALYVEGEEQGLSYTSSIMVAVLVTLGFGALATIGAVAQYGGDPVVYFREQIALALSQVQLPADVKVDPESLLMQVPSAIIAAVIIAAWANSLLSMRMGEVLGIPSKGLQRFGSRDLTSWKLPDAFVWVALGAVGGTFFQIEPTWAKWAATNCLNVAVLLYFFQGLAIVAHFFQVKRVAPIWRSLMYLLIFLQLFVFVALLGFVDLWIDLRGRMKTDKSALA